MLRSSPKRAPRASLAPVHARILFPFLDHAMGIDPLRSTALVAASVVLAAQSSAQVVISDDFETDTSANYTRVDDGIFDGTTTFAFDYVTAGFPLAPRSGMGDTGGLFMSANDTLNAVDGFTLFHNTPVNADIYRLDVDVYMGVPATGGGFGTTEHAHVGVGSDASTWNQLFLPISGDGAYIAFDGDGDVLSDFRWFRDPDNTPAGETDNTTLPNSHPSYLGNGSNNTGPFFQSLFPSPPSIVSGVPGGIWTTVTIEVDNLAGQIAFSFDGQLTFLGDYEGRFDGFTSLGLADTFSSEGPAETITIYDNFTVEIISGSNSIGSNYCTALTNSTGVIGTMGASGSQIATDNNVTLNASNLPVGQFGIFVTSLTDGFSMVPNSGNLCLSGQIGRYQQLNQIQQVDANGQFFFQIDTTMMPQPAVTVPIQPGETWYFQAWHRDFVGGMASSNFTDGLMIPFS
ncbi:MAG: hypothetical protein AAFR54_00850 [Planctomycetota bacterium]